MAGGPPRILVIVQNLPVPTDRRVWLECQALRDAGYTVSVICPKGPGDPDYECHEGVHLYKYAGAPPTRGFLSYLLEFVYSWLRTALLSVRVRRERGFDVLQACNPPDTYWALAALWRPLGVKFVYDQHDLNPELFRSRFGEPKGPAARLQLKGLLWLERMTYRIADHVIVTNGSYRSIARRRGNRTEADTTIVRSGPDTTVMRPVEEVPHWRKGARHLLAYVGILGPQDNGDVLVHVMQRLVAQRGRDDVHLVLMGFGDTLEDLQRLADDLGVADAITFTGRADRTTLSEVFSTADVGLCPDLRTPLNDVSTHNKVMEYMAFGLPLVTFDLTETRVSAGDCAVYVESGDLDGYARAVSDLLDAPSRRLELGLAARHRCVTLLDWRPQAKAYVKVFDDLLGVRADRRDVSTWPHVDRRRSPVPTLPVVDGRRVIDLRDGGRTGSDQEPVPSADIYREVEAARTRAAEGVAVVDGNDLEDVHGTAL